MEDETILRVYDEINRGVYTNATFSDSEVVMISKELYATLLDCWNEVEDNKEKKMMDNFKIGNKVMCTFVPECEKKLTLNKVYLVYGVSERFAGKGEEYIQQIRVLGDDGVPYNTSPQLFTLHKDIRPYTNYQAGKKK